MMEIQSVPGVDHDPETAIAGSAAANLPSTVSDGMFYPGREPRILSPRELKRAASKRKKEEKKELKRKKSIEKKEKRGNRRSQEYEDVEVDAQDSGADMNEDMVPARNSVQFQDASIVYAAEHIKEASETSTIPQDNEHSMATVETVRTPEPEPEGFPADVYTVSPVPPKPKSPLPLSDAQIAEAFSVKVEGKESTPAPSLLEFLAELHVTVDEFVSNAVDDVVDTFGTDLDLPVCSKFLEHLWEDAVASNRDFFDSVNNDDAIASVRAVEAQVEEEEFFDDDDNEVAEATNFLQEIVDDADAEPPTSTPAPGVDVARRRRKSFEEVHGDSIIPAPQQNVEEHRTKRSSMLAFDVKKQKDIARGITPEKNKLTSDAEMIKREMTAQKEAFDAKKVRAGMTGKLSRGDADVSYYSNSSTRYIEQPGVLKFAGDNDRALIEAASAYVFFNKNVNTKGHANNLLKSEAFGTFFLRIDDAGTQLVMSFIHPLGITHHTMTQDSPLEPIKINVSAFKDESTSVQDLTDCYNVEDVLDHLSQTHEYWPYAIQAPLIETQKEGMPPPIVNSRVSAKVHPEIAEAVQKRQSFAKDKMDALSMTSGARRAPPSKPRVLAGTAYKPHEKINTSPMLPPAHSEPLVFKKKPQSSAPEDAREEVEGDAEEETPKISMYFHPDLGKKDAEAKLLEGGGPDGKFLIRPDKKAGGSGISVLLSVMYKGKPTHHSMISASPGAVFAINKAKSKCTTVDDLIEYLGQKRKELKWPVPLKEGIKGPAPAKKKAEKKKKVTAKESIPKSPYPAAATRTKSPTPTNGAGVADVSIQRAALAANLTKDVRVKREFAGAEKHSMDANSVDIRRGRRASQIVGAVRRSRDFVPQENRPSIGLDSEILIRETTAQNVVATARREKAGMTGDIKRGEADVSFFAPKSEDRETKLAENKFLLERTSIADIQAQVTSPETAKPVTKTVHVPNPGKLNHSFEEILAAEAKKAETESYRPKTSAPQPEPEPEAEPQPPAKKKWSVGAVSPTKLKADVTSEPELVGRAAKVAPNKLKPFAPEEKKIVKAMDIEKEAAAAEKKPNVKKTEPKKDPAAVEPASPGLVAAPETTPPVSAPVEEKPVEKTATDNVSEGPPFLHQGIKKSEAEKKILDGGGIAGTFLVRTKAVEADFDYHLEYLLSVVYKGKATHHMITRSEVGGPFTLNGTVTEFKAIDSLIEHLAEKRKALKWPVPLTTAVVR